MLLSPPPSSPPPRKAPRRKQKTAAVAVGLCGTILLLANLANESILPYTRSATIVPRLLLAVTSALSDDNPSLVVRALTTAAYDDEPPANLTSMYQEHDVLMNERRLASPAPPSTDMVPNQYIVGLKAGYTTYENRAQQVAALLSKVGGGTVLELYHFSLEGFSATLTSSQAAALQNEGVVDYVEPNYIVHSRSIADDNAGSSSNDDTTNPNPPLRRNAIVEDQTERNLAIPLFNVKEPAAHWGLERLSSRGGKNGEYVYFHNGENTHVYLFDTAINENHEEFSPFDRFGSESERRVCIGSEDDYLVNTHGTHVASVAAGLTYGTARNSTIHPIQVLHSSGKGTTRSVLCGVEWLINNQLVHLYTNVEDGPRKSIASITFGTNGRSDALDAAIGNLAKKGGIATVVAAGNDNGNACNYSPYDPTAIMIASLNDSVNETNARSSFSNYGPCIDFFAPGADILGASSEGPTSSSAASGTSIAAAIATGVGALYLDEINAKRTKYSLNIGSIPAEVKERMDRRGYRDSVTNPGAGSPNVMITGTATICKGNHHCKAGDQCYFGFCM